MALKKRDTELSECKGVVKIEIGRDTLEASRGILDDIVVMHSKNNLDKNDNVALVVYLSFPNKRQICLQVSKDINRVVVLKSKQSFLVLRCF